MSKRPLVIFGIFAAICLVALPAWALTKKGGSDASNASAVPASNQQGLQLFQINCGACHTLAAAGTDGVVGPNLDNLLASNATKSQETVNGTVRLKLYKGTIMCVGRRSKTDSLFDTTIATFEDDAGAYDQKDAAGFIKLNALRLRIAGNLRRRRG